jgi:hypothetical protein
MQTDSDFPDSWMPIGMYPPEPCETFDVKLPDGSVQQAFWTGKKWWMRGQDVHPREWRIPAVRSA